MSEEVLWSVGSMFNLEDPSTIPGHTALPPTTSYQDLVVDSYTNLRGEYHCTAVSANGTHASSNIYLPSIESETLDVDDMIYTSKHAQQSYYGEHYVSQLLRLHCPVYK